MINSIYIDKQFKDFVKQTSKSSFKIVHDNVPIDYHISMNFKIDDVSIVNNDDYPLLNITNYPLFINKLTDLINLMSLFHSNDKAYHDLNDTSFIDYLLLSCISNMTQTDYNHPLNYLDRMIKAYSHDYNFHFEKSIGKINVDGNEIEILETIKKNHASMEAPICNQFMFKKDNDTFYSPKIHYYISGNDCYIMAIQNISKTSKNSLTKKLDRYFRKLDKGLEYIDKSEGSIETIKDVSPNFLAALTLFLSSNKNIHKFYMCDFLPLKYQNRLEVLKNKGKDIEEAYRIQANITNKFLLTGSRFCEHFENAQASFIDNYLELDVDDYSTQKGNIIYDLYESLSPSNKRNL